MKAVVKGIQVGGLNVHSSLQSACREYADLIAHNELLRSKMHIDIELPDGSMRFITIRDEDGETVAYGDLVGLPSTIDYAKEIERWR